MCGRGGVGGRRTLQPLARKGGLRRAVHLLRGGTRRRLSCRPRTGGRVTEKSGRRFREGKWVFEGASVADLAGQDAQVATLATSAYRSPNLNPWQKMSRPPPRPPPLLLPPATHPLLEKPVVERQLSRRRPLLRRLKPLRPPASLSQLLLRWCLPRLRLKTRGRPPRNLPISKRGRPKPHRKTGPRDFRDPEGSEPPGVRTGRAGVVRRCRHQRNIDLVAGA